MYFEKSIVIALLIWIMSGEISLAQTDVGQTSVTKSESVANERKDLGLTIETDPLLFGGFVAPKGGYGVSLGIERKLGEKLSVYGKASTLNMDLVSAEKNNDLGKDSDQPQMRVEKFSMRSAQLGGRFYFSGDQHSWYAGPTLLIQQSVGTYTYNKNSVDDEVRSTSIGANGGYRWNWQSGLNLRLGGSLAAIVNHKQSTSATAVSETSSEAERKVKRASNTRATGSVDIALGYRF
jgi:hypothetical protein